MFDTKTDLSWKVLNKSFVICNRTINEVCGLYLQDLWFTYKLSSLNDEFKCENDIHFMLLVSTFSTKEVESDLNRFAGGTPYTNEKPTQTCTAYFNFVLHKDFINEYHVAFKNKKIKEKDRINLMCSKGMSELTFNICNVDDKIYLMLPEFKINK
tara:strand:- start:1440 stop:1904 length:465 start_codon:yes stop_codon:yes gene_type:complete